MNEPICEYTVCEQTATEFADVVVDGVQILGFRCKEHMATPSVVDVMLARAKETQQTDIIIAVATQIFEAGAFYRPVGPDMYEVTSQGNKATMMSGHQFHAALSLVHSMKSTTALAVY